MVRRITISASNEVGSLINIYKLRVGKFYKFKDKMAGEERDFIGYVFLKDSTGDYEVAIIESDDITLMNDYRALIHLEPDLYVGVVYELENTVLKYDVVVRNSCMTTVGIRD
jgi:hypothetical protein